VELWLNNHAYLADDRWFDDFRLLRYGTTTAEQALRSGQNWGDPPILSLTQASASALTLTPASFLNLDLVWRLHKTSPDYHLFIQLLAPDQTPVAQYDHGWDTSQWPVGQTRSLRAALWLPPETAPGDYQLILGWYDPTTGQRLASAQSDYAVLGTVQVRPR